MVPARGTGVVAADRGAVRGAPERRRVACDRGQDPRRKLPPLLFQAAATFLVLQLEPQPLGSWFPRAGEAQPPLGAEFADEYRTFGLDHRDRLADLCACHRYQMNEVGRCADLLPALAPAIDTGREIALVDIGTGAGLALHLDRYRYRYRGARGRIVNAGSARSSVEIETDVRGSRFPALPTAPARIMDRIGIDIEPLDLDDPGVRWWLAARIPQEVGAVTRFHQAVQVARENAARAIRGDARELLPEVLAAIPDDRLVCLVDSYVHVSFSDEDLTAFHDTVDRAGADRDLYWVSVDPLVPMGSRASRSVLGVGVPKMLVERNRRDGVFGVIGWLSYRRGRRRARCSESRTPGRPGSSGSDQPRDHRWRSRHERQRSASPPSPIRLVLVRRGSPRPGGRFLMFPRFRRGRPVPASTSTAAVAFWRSDSPATA